MDPLDWRAREFGAGERPAVADLLPGVNVLDRSIDLTSKRREELTVESHVARVAVNVAVLAPLAGAHESVRLSVTVAEFDPLLTSEQPDQGRRNGSRTHFDFEGYPSVA